MSKYMIKQPDIDGRVWIEDTENGKVFNGYDFMGNVIWEDYGGDAYWAEPGEAEQIVRDLEAADEEPVNPADKKYLLKTCMDGIKETSVRTGRQLASFYETCNTAGLFSDYDYIKVYDIEGEPKQVYLWAVAEPILEQQRWMDQEYRDYCDNDR